MPPFVRQKQQFSDAQNRDCYKIASVRIHVERAIARLRQFMILKFLPHDLYKHIDKILKILAFIVNNFNPLINDDDSDEEDTESDTENSDNKGHTESFNSEDSMTKTSDENLKSFLVFQK